MLLRLYSALVAAISIGICSSSLAKEYDFLQHQHVHDFIHSFAQRSAYSQNQLEDIFAKITHQQRVIDLINTPAEKQYTWQRYRQIFIQPTRIAAGKKFLQQHATILTTLERKYGVPREYLVAILGVETKYGANTGGFKVLEALATLAFDYPRRGVFFTNELKHYLRLTKKNNFDSFHLVGSYAGAMGIPQFMPSSYSRYALGYNGAKRSDIWTNNSDALASVANYLAKKGWQRNRTVLIQIGKPTNQAQRNQAIAAANSTLKPNNTWSKICNLGLIATTGVYEDSSYALFHVKLNGVDQFFVGSYNFYVLSRYNPNLFYALAVHQLAEQLS